MCSRSHSDTSALLLLAPRPHAPQLVLYCVLAQARAGPEAEANALSGQACMRVRQSLAIAVVVVAAGSRVGDSGQDLGLELRAAACHVPAHVQRSRTWGRMAGRASMCVG